MKVEKAIELASTIASIQRAGRPMPTAFGFVLALNAEKLKPVCASYETARQDLIKQYGKRGEDGELEIANGNITIADTESFTAAMIELTSHDAAVELDKVNIEKLPAEMEPSWVAGLMPMLDT